jgi:trk system potassium uptake protein TrkA
MSMNVVVIGYGRFGRHLVQELQDSGLNPYLTIVDHDEAAFRELPVDFDGLTLVKDTSDLSLFEDVRIQHTDAFFAITDHPNLNFMLAHVAQELYKVPQVMARMPFAEKQQSFAFFGVTMINPLMEAARLMVASISEKVGD